MSHPQQGRPAEDDPSPLWFAAASVVLALGVVLAAFFGWRAVGSRPSSPQPVESGPVRLHRDGLTIYSSQPVLRPPCEVKDPTGQMVPLVRPAAAETITLGSETWYVVFRSVRPVPAGVYSISCPDVQTNATYAVGPRSSVLGFAGAILAAVASLGVLGLLGLALLIVALVKRRRVRRPGAIFPGGPFQQDAHRGQNLP